MSSWPIYDQEQIDAVSRVLASGKVNAWTGPDVRAFEDEYCAYTDAAHAIAMANGTVTLDAVMHVLDLNPGDEVIVTPRSFIASASSVMLAGGTPVFADIDPVTQNLTIDTIAPLITPRTRGIIPVHLGGWPCDMDAIMDLARAHDLWVIEDCAQAHGAMIGNRHVGTIGTIGSFSFCQDKIMTTGGEGGLLLTNDDALWSRIWSYKDHGKGYDTVFNTDHPPGFRWLHDSGPGTNLRMTGPSAALGRVQLKRLNNWRAHRTMNAELLADALSTCPAFRVPIPPKELTHAYYRFYAFVRPQALAAGWSRDRIIAEIADTGFPAFSGSCSEIYLEETFQKNGLGPTEPLPVARELGETSLAFLVDPAWSPEDIARLAQVIVDVGNRALAAQKAG
ncbi:DegT/DnrJ/EryC1/StrS aminotransferase family protein [Rhodobacteraceae bacterium B1Z28]|uniref:DegT/DnrJ/EryC1/StrS aminotransferase family protein n=1 Tax=Ruegeria haliotis TaxID=2747601 RepID=A0ABX2PRS6_9RHOB|nr:DegT/DnrJ/EryC1/StrS aminotransferase family protein [Ruegeria haliotis]NVO56371.1 DegT/DnrJ/EryC1/StrS aminotransferase family protein [Ruegeria haliotis]